MDQLLYSVLLFAVSVTSVAALALAVRAAPPQDRQRISWVLLVWGFYAVTAALYASYPMLDLPLQIGYTAIPVVLTYAVLARRMLDIGFVVNRAAVFAVVSAIIVSLFVLVEWALATWFEDLSHATSLAVNAALAIGIGLSLRFIHHHVDRAIDSLFFRKRHDNEKALRRFAREAGFITDKVTLLDRTEAEVLGRTEATFARILLARDIPANDPAVLAMKAWHEPVDISAYRSELQGELAIPMIAHDSLAGVILCGEKRNGESYAPDEIDALATMAHGVALALSELDRNSGNESLQPILTAILARLDMLTGDRMSGA